VGRRRFGEVLIVRSVTISACTLAALSVVLLDCTFGGIANYEIGECEPKSTQADDVCERLNKGSDPKSCVVYQCDRASKRCIQKPRDDDRDGDPTPACGGTDCDDQNPARSGRTAEICDSQDNNCNGVVDEDVVKPEPARTVVTPGALPSEADALLSSADRQSLLGVYVDQGKCLPLVSLTHNSGDFVGGAGCFLLSDEQALVPRQPFAALIGANAAAAFIGTSGCTGTGRLFYRFRTSTEKGGAELPCDATHPASLPAFAVMPNGVAGLVAWYEAPIGERQDPINGCAAAKPATLAVAAVGNAITSPITLQPVRVGEPSIGTRPPALLSVAELESMVMVAPFAGDVGVWLLKLEQVQSGTLPAPVRIPGLANARATAVAARTEGGVTTLAVVAETGCAPAASVVMTLGTVDAGAKSVTFGPVVPVVGPSTIATLPSAAWVARRKEWWVSWVDSTPSARFQRFDPAAKPIGGVIEAGRLINASVSSTESVFGYNPSVAGGSFVEIPMCGVP